MNKQRGAIPIFVIPILLKGFAALAVAGAVWWVWSTWTDGRAAIREVKAARAECPGRSESMVACIRAVKAEFAEFRGKVESLGKEAKERARIRELEDAKAKEKADAKHRNELLTITGMYRGLRDARTRGGIVPEASRTAGVPDGVVCFNRQAVDRALQEFAGSVETGLARGDGYRVDLACAQGWTREIKP